jgi:hypothetical protein
MMFPYQSVSGKCLYRICLNFCVIIRQHTIFKGQTTKKIMPEVHYSNVHVMEHFTVCQGCHVVASDTASASM